MDHRRHEEPAVPVSRLDAVPDPLPQDDQLMSEHRILRFKPALRLEWRGQDGQGETDQPDHSASLGDSITSSTRMGFSVHTHGCAGSCKGSKARLENFAKPLHSCSPIGERSRSGLLHEVVKNDGGSHSDKHGSQASDNKGAHLLSPHPQISSTTSSRQSCIRQQNTVFRRHEKTPRSRGPQRFARANLQLRKNRLLQRVRGQRKNA
jgi:hypothetical protein